LAVSQVGDTIRALLNSLDFVDSGVLGRALASSGDAFGRKSLAIGVACLEALVVNDILRMQAERGECDNTCSLALVHHQRDTCLTFGGNCDIELSSLAVSQVGDTIRALLNSLDFVDSGVLGRALASSGDAFGRKSLAIGVACLEALVVNDILRMQAEWGSRGDFLKCSVASMAEIWGHLGGVVCAVRAWTILVGKAACVSTGMALSTRTRMLAV